MSGYLRVLFSFKYRQVNKSLCRPNVRQDCQLFLCYTQYLVLLCIRSFLFLSRTTEFGLEKFGLEQTIVNLGAFIPG